MMPTAPSLIALCGAKRFRESSDEEIAAHAGAIVYQLHTHARRMHDSLLLRRIAEEAVLSQMSLSAIVAAVLAEKASAVLNRGSVELNAFSRDVRMVLSTPPLLRCLVCDLYKIVQSDPACESLLQPVLFFKGFHALCLHRVAHTLWTRNTAADRLEAFQLQAMSSELFCVDIHPAAKVSPGVMMDHASSVVIGSTAVIGSDVYILHQITLGGTGKHGRGEKRHPTIGDGVNLGASCTILGDITIGQGSTVGAGAIVTRSVPSGSTVVGVNRILPSSPDAASMRVHSLHGGTKVVPQTRTDTQPHSRL